MGKIFVHHPLKRADLRRLSEPPRPIEPVALPPAPKVDPEERARRAAFRAEFRAALQKDEAEFKFELEIVRSAFRNILIRSDDFCQWMFKRFEEDPNLRSDLCDGRDDSLFIEMLSPHETKQCMYCSCKAIRRPGSGWAGIMVPIAFEMKPREVFSYVLCDHCGKLKDKTITYKASEVLLRHIKYKDKTVNGLIRKCGLETLDLEYLTGRVDKGINGSQPEVEEALDALHKQGLIGKAELPN